MQGDGATTRTSRRVKVLGVVGIALVLVVSLGILAIGGAQDGTGGHGASEVGPDHGPGHAGGGTRSDDGHHAGNDSESRRAPVTWTVEARDDAFVPTNLTIQAGDTVEWVHNGSNSHTVTADDGSFDSHPDCATVVDGALGRCMAADDTYSGTFEQVGKVLYGCKIHADQGMKAVIHVQEFHGRTPEANHH
jgi:plastocyanin